MSASSEKFELAADDLDSSLERVTASIDSIENRHEYHASHISSMLCGKLGDDPYMTSTETETCKISGLTIVSLNLKKFSLQNLKGLFLIGGGVESQFVADSAGIVAGNRLQMQERAFFCRVHLICHFS